MRNEVGLSLGDINALQSRVHPAPLALAMEAPIAAFPPVDVKVRRCKRASVHARNVSCV